MSTVDDERRANMERKVQGLMAKADKAGTPEEAEAFAAKAQELLTKYSLDEMALRAKVNGGQGGSEKMTKAFVEITGTFMKQDWALWSSVARANSVYVVTKDWGKGEGMRGLHLFGAESDITNVRLLATALQLQVVRLSANLPDEYKDLKAFDKFVWRRSFREGFADAIRKRMTKAMEDAARSHSSGDMLPVLASKRDAAELFGKQELGGVGKARASNIKVSGHGLVSGRAAGARADVGNVRVSGGTRGALGSGS